MKIFSNFLPFAPAYIRVVAILYICAAAVYTTNSLITSATRIAIAQLPRELVSSSAFLRRVGDSDASLGARTSGVQSLRSKDNAKSRLVSAKTTSERILWEKSLLQGQGGLLFSGLTRGLDQPSSTDAGIFLSKAFATSQEHLSFNDQSNMQVIPFYYRGSLEHDSEDITITTLVTRDRFLVFKQLVERYRAPISATVHVSKKELEEDSGNGFISALHKIYRSSPSMALFVDIHLVVTPASSDRQFNTWRNIARMFARTDYVMMLDVDFVPCTDFSQRLKLALGDEIKELVRSGKAALVVPAFEFTKHEDGLDASTFPTTKEAMAVLYNNSRIAMFHNTWAPGHNSTDYPRMLFHSRPGEVYKVQTYQHSYEPYVIFRKEGPGAGIPWCDERFVGYGGNKAACLFEMYLSGVSFYVLSDDFLVHQSHVYDEMARKLERRYNRKIYADFREETCLKYLKAFLDSGTLQSPNASNVREECKKVRGISRLVSQVSIYERLGSHKNLAHKTRTNTNVYNICPNIRCWQYSHREVHCKQVHWRY